jgi:dUTPase
MTLIAGDRLVHSHFFSSGTPTARGTSFDLTIGSIFDHTGKKIDEPFNLEPGQMVQVVSAEVFKLPDTITGHVTYKTELTKNGIWALTVGIIDPGWNGPIATTLLNFSRVDHAVAQGDKFLRVTFFEHAAVPHECLESCESVNDYLLSVRKTAMTRFPQTFLNKEEIANNAGDAVLKRIRLRPWHGLR